jgi:hypothetical protein
VQDEVYVWSLSTLTLKPNSTTPGLNGTIPALNEPGKNDRTTTVIIIVVVILGSGFASLSASGQYKGYRRAQRHQNIDRLGRRQARIDRPSRSRSARLERPVVIEVEREEALRERARARREEASRERFREREFERYEEAPRERFRAEQFEGEEAPRRRPRAWEVRRRRDPSPRIIIT